MHPEAYPGILTSSTAYNPKFTKAKQDKFNSIFTLLYFDDPCILKIQIAG